MKTTLATYTETEWTYTDVCGVWLAFSSGRTSNSLVFTRDPSGKDAKLELVLQKENYRRTAHREPSARFYNDLVMFVVEVSRGWPTHNEQPTAARGAVHQAAGHATGQAEPASESDAFNWQLSLTAADGSSLRECAGDGIIPDAEGFFALAHGLDHVSRGFVLGVGPLARIDRALRHPSIAAYDAQIDSASGGLLSLAIAKEYYAEAYYTRSRYQRSQCFKQARIYYTQAASFGSAQALAHLGLMELEPGIAHDSERAYRYFEQASEQGSAEACSLLADLIVDAKFGECDEAQALELYERGYKLASVHFDTGVQGFCAERLAQALASGVAGAPDLARAADLCVEAELSLAAALMQGELWLQPSYQRAQALSERLARMKLETSEL